MCVSPGTGGEIFFAASPCASFSFCSASACFLASAAPAFSPLEQETNAVTALKTIAKVARMIATKPNTAMADMRHMRAHHTKNKGDLGILYAQLDLAKKGYGVLTPLTEHEAFDLVAYKDDRFYRVQVKYRAAVNGRIDARFSTVWADRHGLHTRLIDKSSVDVY